MVGEDVIKESFRRVREDFEKRDAELNKLKQELNSLRAQVNEVLPALLETNKLILSRLEELEARLIRRDPIKEQLLKKYSKKRKELVMGKILEVCVAREVTLPELRRIIVDELGYCSKSSFYRYIELLRRLGRLEIVEINGLEFVKPLSQLSSH